jgi:hypothetical protein
MIGSAALGLLAVVIGFMGILFGAKWLLNRLLTERLRQFHFQTFIWRLSDIAESCKDDGKKQ